MIYCRKHHKFEKVIGYHRDDPILQCGIIKQCSKNNCLEQCKEHLERFFICHLIDTNKSMQDLVVDLYLCTTY
jgi:hypothetical protein